MERSIDELVIAVDSGDRAAILRTTRNVVATYDAAIGKTQ